MKKIKLMSSLIVLIIILQFLFFIFIKQRFSELERKNKRLENEISIRINENNLLKVKITMMQNPNKIRKIVEKYLLEYHYMKPNQVIEKNSI